MEYKTLGNSELNVSKICLGTMTFGEQNTESEAFEQLDYAIDQGINFIDTAEMYPVPPRPNTQGRTETYIGRWMQARGNRNNIILATKITGPADWVSHIRGSSRFNETHIEQAVNDSLTRLQTDYIDLYQLHWPERSTNYFGIRDYPYETSPSAISLHETLSALKKQVDSGKIRYIGLSNETAWGTMHALSVAKTYNLPCAVSIQNPYSLLNRTYEIGLSEVSHHENIPLLAYSPLAFGVLSGKYLNNQWPEGARITLFKRFSRYLNPTGIKATEEYVQLAKDSGLTPCQLALSFVNSRPFVGSNIIGATNLNQLKENIESIDTKLNNDALEKIEKIHNNTPNPCP